MALINAIGAVFLLLGSFLVIWTVWSADSQQGTNAAEEQSHPEEPSYPRAA